MNAALGAMNYQVKKRTVQDRLARAVPFAPCALAGKVVTLEESWGCSWHQNPSLPAKAALANTPVMALGRFGR